jgi:hypothetical protein
MLSGLSLVAGRMRGLEFPPGLLLDPSSDRTSREDGPASSSYATGQPKASGPASSTRPRNKRCLRKISFSANGLPRFIVTSRTPFGDGIRFHVAVRNTELKPPAKAVDARRNRIDTGHRFGLCVNLSTVLLPMATTARIRLSVLKLSLVTR